MKIKGVLLPYNLSVNTYMKNIIYTHIRGHVDLETIKVAIQQLKN